MRFIGSLARFWVLIVFVCLSIYFGTSNPERVFLSFPPFIKSISLPLGLVFACSLFTGATLVILFFGVDHVKNTWKIRKLNKRLDDIESISGGSGTREHVRQAEPAVISGDQAIDDDV